MSAQLNLPLPRPEANAHQKKHGPHATPDNATPNNAMPDNATLGAVAPSAAGGMTPAAGEQPAKTAASAEADGCAPFPDGISAVALDFETSGYGPNSACALGMAKVRGGEVTDTFYRLIRPPRRRMYFTEVHGITWPMVEHCPTFAELWPEIFNFLDGATYFIAHNASFDRAVLHGSCHAMGLNAPKTPFLCTLKGSRRAFALRHNRLSDVCEFLHIELNHHHAGSDALAAALICLELRRRGLDWAGMKL